MYCVVWFHPTISSIFIYIGFMVSGVVAYTYKQSWDKTVRTTTKVSVTFERQCITSSNCTMCPDRLWCQHIIAVIMYRIRHANKVSDLTVVSAHYSYNPLQDTSRQ